MRIPGPVQRALSPIARRAAGLGLPLFAVGGCVRDWTLGVPSRDLDLVVEGDPRPLAAACARALKGKARPFSRFGTVRVEGPGSVRLDFARARAESYPRPAALPVVRPASIREDLARRDFSINAMALPVGVGGPGGVLDPHGGAADLAAKRLRVLHEASFVDDPTRLFRAARYAGRFGLAPEPATARLLAEAARGGFAARLSRERVRQELMRILEESDPGPALALLGQWGFLGSFHPAFRWVPSEGDAWVRLGRCALAMGPAAGAELLRSLPLSRGPARELAAALKAAGSGAVPPSALPPLARRTLAGSVPAAALGPRLVRGSDLRALGLAPGPAFAPLLERAARAQWEGEFATRAQALAWVKEALSRA